MQYDHQREFFLVRDDNTGTTKVFHRWWNVVDFLTDDIMKNRYNIFYDEAGTDPNLPWMAGWRPPKDREECFNFLFSVKNITELNDILEDLWHTELVEFSD